MEQWVQVKKRARPSGADMAARSGWRTRAVISLPEVVAVGGKALSVKVCRALRLTPPRGRWTWDDA